MSYFFRKIKIVNKMTKNTIFILMFFPFWVLAQPTINMQSNISEVMMRSVVADNLVKAGQFEQALFEYDNILEAAPDYVDGYMRRALLLSRLGRLPEAIQDYNTAKQLDPYVVEVFDIYGRINKMKVLKNVELENQEDASIALKEVQQKMEEDKNNPVLYFTRANLEVLLGLYKDAIKDYDRAIQLKSDYVEAIYNRGIVYIILNNKALACDDFYQSSQLGSERANKKYLFFCRK